jgi:mono/diheme cytochrome c family protein
MLKNLLIFSLAAVLAVGAGYADQANSKVVIPLKPTAPVSGKQMYTNYCAPCHGVDGTGNGPVATALKQPPVDLTVLSKNNGGKFPSSHIVAVLQYGTQIPSHGTAQMPVWGPVLGKMDKASTQESQLRISNLSRFLQTIQTR